MISLMEPGGIEPPTWIGAQVLASFFKKHVRVAEG